MPYGEPNPARMSDLEFEEIRRRRSATQQIRQEKALRGELQIVEAQVRRLDSELTAARAEIAALRALIVVPEAAG